MKSSIKLALLFVVVLMAYSTAYMRAYTLSSDYYEFATEQVKQQNYMLALKGKNKLELKRDETYLGGYQSVIETWENGILVIKPDFYYEALTIAPTLIDKLSQDELFTFIDIYMQQDLRFVPEVIERLITIAKAEGDEYLYQDMTELLQDAFPDYQSTTIDDEE